MKSGERLIAARTKTKANETRTLTNVRVTPAASRQPHSLDISFIQGTPFGVKNNHVEGETLVMCLVS